MFHVLDSECTLRVSHRVQILIEEHRREHRQFQLRILPPPQHPTKKQRRVGGMATRRRDPCHPSHRKDHVQQCPSDKERDRKRSFLGIFGEKLETNLH